MHTHDETPPTTPPEHISEHGHSHPQGRVFQALFPLWMLVGRGGMAREVARTAGLTWTDVVVDVGCGPGTAVRQARRVGAGRVLGVDPDARMLRLARWITSLRRVTGVSYVEGGAEELPLDSGTADVVWAVQSVHHWADRSRGMQEVRRVLAPGGRIVFMEGYVVPGARGRAAHGLTASQAEKLTAELAQIGFHDVAKRTVRIGTRTFVVITGTAASA